MLLSIAGPTDLTLHEVNRAADTITRVAHPDANIIFGAVVDDALGEEVRVTVIAAGFDKLVASPHHMEGRLSRLLEEPSDAYRVPESAMAGASRMDDGDLSPMPSILVEDEDDIFRPAPETVTFDAEEDLDIPDFLKS